VRTVAPARAFAWLLLGWRDFRQAFLPSLAHGVLAALIGRGIFAVGRSAWPLLPGAFSGFVVMRSTRDVDRGVRLIQPLRSGALAEPGIFT
jgi:hypothetical protein